MENKTKAQTFIGFAIRAKKYRIGMNAVQTLKRIELIIICRSASENTKKEAKKVAKKYNCTLIESTMQDLEQITFTPNAKVMAITDKALAKAILENIASEFIVVD